ncbi:MAG: D-tyrosyl-tRNA(Tyr) deacylase [Anaerolineaceae bacterium]|nr:D-tyrosyl-tRNA(Tyr) deacylase [Anaerolineaceae bacterium]
MRAVIQRARYGSVSVDEKIIAEIQKGLVILLGVGPEDTEAEAQAMARKAALLRIFEDDQGKMNRSILDIGGEALVVSQFTLYGDTRKGNRPSFIGAAQPDLARPLVERFADFLREQGIPTQTGEFGTEMLVKIENAGPVTILLEM